MDTISAALACCLLCLSSAGAQTADGNLTVAPTATSQGFTAPQPSSAVNASVASDVTKVATSFTSTAWDSDAVSETTSPPPTSEQPQSTAVPTPPTNTSTTPSAHAPVLTVQTTAGYISTPDAAAMTAQSSHAAGTPSHSEGRLTRGFGLELSEKILTVVFSVALGVFAVALLTFTFHRCKHKIQYLHQPLNDTTDADAFTADDDTLVISGGLYDGHPIYDNVPTAPEDQSQFRLEFLH